MQLAEYFQLHFNIEITGVSPVCSIELYSPVPFGLWSAVSGSTLTDSEKMMPENSNYYHKAHTLKIVIY